MNERLENFLYVTAILLVASGIIAMVVGLQNV